MNISNSDRGVLKAIISNPLIGNEFAKKYNHELFDNEIRDFSKIIIDYIKNYKSIPTKRVLLDLNSKDQDTSEYIDGIWDEINNFEYDVNEYNYDLSILKKRFKDEKISDLNRRLKHSEDPDAAIKDIELTIQRMRSISNGETYIQRTLKEDLPIHKEEILAIQKDPSLGRGISTGYSAIDFATDGLRQSELFIIGGETSSGKMIPLDTPIPTPDGMKLMSDIHPGDFIFGSDGNPYKVLAESEVRIEPGWKFIFSDNTEIISHEDHLWLTLDRKEQVGLNRLTDEFRMKQRAKRSIINNTLLSNKCLPPGLKQPSNGTVRTTFEIINSIKTIDGRNNHAIPINKALNLPEKKLLIDPYVLGLWLGDGHPLDGRITTADYECIEAVVKSGYKLSKIYTKKNEDGTFNKASTYSFLGFLKDLRKINVYNNKHVPLDYLWGSKEQRLALLQGLMDSDGYASKEGKIDFVNTNKRIADAVVFIINSLGEKCTITEGKSILYGKVHGPKWTVRFSPTDTVFRLQRKIDRQNVSSQRLNRFRYIKAAERTEAVPMKCIQVSSPDNLYLAGNNFIPTHNSMLLNNMAINMWMQQNTILTNKKDFIKGHNILYFSLEMNWKRCRARTLARLANIPMNKILKANFSREEQDRLDMANDFIANYPYEFQIIDVPRGVTPEQIELRYLEAATKFTPEIVVIDYLGIMESELNDIQDWLKQSFLAGQIHELSRTYGFVGITAVQLTTVDPGKGKEGALDPENNVGAHRLSRSKGILHHANSAIQIIKRKNEKQYGNFLYQFIKNRDGESDIKGSCVKNFANATLLDINFSSDSGGGGEDDKADISNLLNSKPTPVLQPSIPQNIMDMQEEETNYDDDYDQ